MQNDNSAAGKNCPTPNDGTEDKGQREAGE